jgi:transcriptional regulator with XRE-family HTH domain
MNRIINTNPDFKKFLETVGVNLYALRTEQDLEIETVAKAVKISSRLLRRIEKGEHNMRIESLSRLCGFYRVAPREIATEKKLSNEA